MRPVQCASLLLVALLASIAEAGEVLVCLASQADVSKCNDQMLFLGQSFGVSFKCVSGGSEIGCARKIRDEAADVTVLGDVELYWANKRYGLVAFVSEDYRTDLSTPAKPSDLVSYYSIAVVRKDNPLCGDGPTSGIAGLKGAKACHTGYRKNAGWNLPVGFLAASSNMEVIEDPSELVNTDAYSVAQYFKSVCAPRTTDDGPRIRGTKYDRLCDHCKGDCSENDPYAGYSGAFQCMSERFGDVAFVKHTTPDDEGLTDKEKEEFRLLCYGETAGCRTLDFYTAEGCSFGERPPSALVGREGWGTTKDGEAAIKALTTNKNAFTKTKSFLWTDDAKALAEVQNPKNFKGFMRSYDNYDQIFQMGDVGGGPTTTPSPTTGPSAPAPSSSSSSGSNGGVSKGGAAGIAIGCFFGGIFVLAIIMFFVNKRKASNWDSSPPPAAGGLPGFTHSNNPMAEGPPTSTTPPELGGDKPTGPQVKVNNVALRV